MERSNSNFGIGLFIGIFLGVLGGVLLAPSTGEETRRKLMDANDDFQSNVKTLSKKMKTETEDLLEKGKTFIKNLEASASSKHNHLEEQDDILGCNDCSDDSL